MDWMQKQLILQDLVADHMSTTRPPSREAKRRATVLMQAIADAGYAIVPVKPSEKMLEELARIGDGPSISGAEVWGYMLAAAGANPFPESN